MAQTTFSVGSCALHILVCLMNSGHATSCHASAEAKLWSDRMSNFSSNIASDLDDADTTANAIIADDMTVYGDSNWMSYGYAHSEYPIETGKQDFIKAALKGS
ncbi:hypothetical protein CLAFUW4_12738 [Fulvia fulva]|uniref:NTF2-like domain-containing protein n=1 Tax=Passalora fulva TaxID=5499 RepID=A0A9Q8PKC5_PASFU|nr:uncharacterized protein CLAFUR5_12604 [Fulvia fulva]KAK4611731.1 hypothetical protein CLAFUR4_12742 [Fulvia fulva]KAK4612798.1 hypothetical protein CLAFUR0_12749 [Fulvia fulva]UJO24090.1 hypothetical protein CLAFUR5_12604 [Fulvia fulva]WPV21169.1 hypothetical protein CLAFUW4_12738 [Fulvia fulva]WPV36175.1 hypothetical protein CLAFUW7_12745 [Fulvia fulva]